ncbi:SH3 domain-binding protein 1-like [Pongo abelii]|uniref:SH3 domain-binding protein 1-like n=1 Tax=Pongo abelii TaxID=9601 RepID=UPI003004E3C5
MATLRPHKQLPPLPLASTSPRRPRALATLSGGNSLRTPSFCRPLPRHPTPYPPLRPGSAHSRPRAPRWGRRSARPAAPGTAMDPFVLGNHDSRPHPLPVPVTTSVLQGEGYTDGTSSIHMHTPGVQIKAK